MFILLREILILFSDIILFDFKGSINNVMGGINIVKGNIV